MPKAPPHIHVYRRHKKHKSIYYCSRPDCFHRMDKAYLDGKRAECPNCGKEYLLDYEALRRAFPRCPSCRGDAGAQNYQAALGAVTSVLAAKIVRDISAGETDDNEDAA